jgi:hypothetical protein
VNTQVIAVLFIGAVVFSASLILQALDHWPEIHYVESLIVALGVMAIWVAMIVAVDLKVDSATSVGIGRLMGIAYVFALLIERRHRASQSADRYNTVGQSSQEGGE